ncbi:MAG: hypothetical protein NVSMB65_09360 [Chloroflexota bacterium]
MVAWAIAEATVWPIIPDALLVPLSIADRRRYYIRLAAAVAGMALGGIGLYLFAYEAPQRALFLLRHLPLVGNKHIAIAHASLAAHGAAAFLIQPWSGVPFKVWAIEAGVEGIPPVLAIPTFIVARGLRMALISTLARLFAGWFAGLVRDAFLLLVTIYVLLFSLGLWWLLR